jgi:conjugative transposon TraM protein
MKLMNSVKQKQKMLILPLLIIPFLTLAFWAMGGGKGIEKPTVTKSSIGLNLHLPDPKLKIEKPLDKLGFYDKADKDSLKLKEAMRNDPYYKNQLINEKQPGPSSTELEQIAQNSEVKFHQSSLNQSPYNTSTSEAEEKLMQKLGELNKVINQPQPKGTEQDNFSYLDHSLKTNSRLDNHVDHLENMMQSVNQNNNSDPELQQLSGMMDKIMDIQHPERVKQRLNEKKNEQKQNAFTVSNQADDDTIANGFYSLDNDEQIQKSNAIQAVVNENQTLVNGAVIKLRLLSDIFINKEKIPTGTFVFGIVALDGERLNIEINSIKCNNSIFNVRMEIYDMDGLPGIYIPGAITRDVTKQSADNSLQLMQMTSLDPSLKAQATAAGLGTLKNLLSRKVKLIKVSVKAGYKILLKNKTENL